MTEKEASPGFADMDAWGLTHPGRVRTENQDHFFIGALARSDGSVLPVRAGDEDAAAAERLASLGVVADGVGSATGGREAARHAVERLVSAVARFYPDATDAESRDPEVFSRFLHEAALDCHEALVARSRSEGGERRFATTVTLFLGLWPHAYLLQVGDSRCYIFRDGKLNQISRDQTLAQDLVDQGVLTRTMAEQSRWANVLSSAIGGSQAVPVVTRVIRDWGTVVLLCSDGLTRHVPDERITERLTHMTGCRQLCEALLQDALDGGGTDNVTIMAGQSLRRAGDGRGASATGR